MNNSEQARRKPKDGDTDENFIYRFRPRPFEPARTVVYRVAVTGVSQSLTTTKTRRPMIDCESNAAKREEEDVSSKPDDVYAGLNGKCV
jgi:hypothetical protein